MKRTRFRLDSFYRFNVKKGKTGQVLLCTHRWPHRHLYKSLEHGLDKASCLAFPCKKVDHPVVISGVIFPGAAAQAVIHIVKPQRNGLPGIGNAGLAILLKKVERLAVHRPQAEALLVSAELVHRLAIDEAIIRKEERESIFLSLTACEGLSVEVVASFQAKRLPRVEGFEEDVYFAILVPDLLPLLCL